MQPFSEERRREGKEGWWEKPSKMFTFAVQTSSSSYLMSRGRRLDRLKEWQRGRACGFRMEIDHSFLIISKLALVLQRFGFQIRLESFAITIKFLYNGTIPEG